MQPIKKDTNRIAKVNSLIEHSLGPILHEALDWQNGIVTISRVETSRDMKWAKVWISVFYPKSTPTKKNAEQDPAVLDKAILSYLSKNIYHIQGEMNKNFHTKIIPKISFYLDTAPRYVEHIDELIREVHKEK